MSPSVQAATITVTNTNDSGTGSLREAIAIASPGDTINFSLSTVPATIALTTGELLISNNLNIVGPGSRNLVLDANQNTRLFSISGGIVKIEGITISKGSDASAGAILNSGDLTINNCTISENSAEFGGAIYNNANMVINQSTLSNNIADCRGGCAQWGGAVFNQGSLNINNSTISGNTGFIGGGIFNGVTASLIIQNSTFSNNSGGIGGAIFNNGVATTTIGSSILNTGGSFGENIYNNSGTVISLGFNLSNDAAGGDSLTNPGGLLNANGDIRNTDPLISLLQDNGGFTFTHALTDQSPAIDQGKNLIISATDQRGTGFSRTFDDPAILNSTGGDGTDIGAYEHHPSFPTSKDQCKNGGWKAFGFKNQGQCIKFVNTGK